LANHPTLKVRSQRDCNAKTGGNMSGLILLAVVAFVLWAIVWVAKTLGNTATNPLLRSTLKWLIFFVLISLPFIDEVIGKYQLEALCKANGIESADVSKARGRSVKVEFGERKELDGTIMPMKESDVFFKDATDGDVLIHHKTYYAIGGWLMRYTWLNMGSAHPMLFGGFCDRRLEQEIFKTNAITFLYK
jgi:hypothetical protein